MLTALIAFDLGFGRVCGPIHFDNEPRRQTREVDDERIDGNLLPELKAHWLQGAKLTPQCALGVGSIAAELAGKFVGHGGLYHPTPYPSPSRGGESID